MPIPALSKTYVALANVPFPDTSTTLLLQKSYWWVLKALLTNQSGIGGTLSAARPSGSVWTHVASCDGVSVSTVTDLWGTTFDASKLVPNQNGVAHSWWRGTNGTHDIVLDMNFNTPNIGQIKAAPISNFSVGSTTSGPQSTKDWDGNGSTNSPAAPYTVFAQSTVTPAAGAAFKANLIVNDSDHSFTFLASPVGTGVFTDCLAFQVLEDSNDSFNRWWLRYTGALSGRSAPTAVALAAHGRRRDDLSVKSAGGIMTRAAGGVALAGAHARDSITGDFWLDPVEIRDLTASHNAYRGKVSDWYFAGNTPVGTRYGADDEQMIVAGDFIMPFPGTVPLL